MKLAPAILLAVPLSTPSAAAQTTANLGYAVVDWRIEGDVVAFTVDEAAAGGLDRNGDGDAVDHVVHVHDLAAGRTANLGLSASISDPGLAVAGGRVIFTVFEFMQGMTDLTGDGDKVDLVLHVYDPASQTTVNTALALYVSRFEATEGVVAAMVREHDQGYTDLNGDGDALDAVVHAVDPSTGTSANLGLQAYAWQLNAGADLIAFKVQEKEQGAADLNGDGDADDWVQHVHDAGTGKTWNLGLASSATQVIAEDGFAAFLADEAHQGADLNGDGDTGDDVFYVYEAASEATLSSGFAAGGGPASWEVFDLDAGRAAFRVSEFDHFIQDLNGDGDTGDNVVHVMHLPFSASTNLGVGAYDLRLEGNLLVSRASESQEGHTDLNGDGDASDRVLQLHDLIAGTRENLALHVAEDDGGYDLSGAIIACRWCR